MSTFSGLNTATTALWANQRAMDVTGQNVTNANTDGYSRQRVEMRAISGNGVPAIWSVSREVAGGVDANNVTRIRDAFLEARAQSEHGITSRLTVQKDAFSAVEDAYREPGDTGLQNQLAQMWAGWSDVMNHPTEPGARSQVLQRTATLVAGLHTTDSTLSRQWNEHWGTAQNLLDDVNSTAASIATLNQAIKTASVSRLPTNELADKRDALVLHLSDEIGATANPRDDGTLDVVVGGTSLVSGTTSLKLVLAGSPDPTDAKNQTPGTTPRVETSPGGAALSVGGTVQGHLDAMTSVIPDSMRQLDQVAQRIADKINGVHDMTSVVPPAVPTAYDQNGNPGGPVFTNATTGTTTGITAANINLAITDPKQLAASSQPPLNPGPPATGISTDNGNAQKLYQLRLDGDSPDTVYRQMIVGLGVQAAVSATNLDTQSAISSQVDGARESVYGVNLDEEMTNMLQFQHGYQAAGRLVTAIDEMLDTLINRTGVVGR